MTLRRLGSTAEPAGASSASDVTTHGRNKPEAISTVRTIAADLTRAGRPATRKAGDAESARPRAGQTGAGMFGYELGDIRSGVRCSASAALRGRVRRARMQSP